MRDEIIKMAIKAHLVMYDYEHPSLERFFHMAQAAEREGILGLADSLGWGSVDHIRARGNT